MSRRKKPSETMEGYSVPLSERASAPTTKAPDLFPETHKEAVLFSLDNYEKSINDLMQKTIDAISKKNEELAAIGVELKAIRLAKQYVKAEMPGPEEWAAEDKAAAANEKDHQLHVDLQVKMEAEERKARELAST